MRLREERIDIIAQAIVDRLAEDELIDLTMDEEALGERIGVVIAKDLAREDEIQREAVEWVRKHRAHMVEGTSEWSIELDRKRQEIAVTRGYVLP